MIHLRGSCCLDGRFLKVSPGVPPVLIAEAERRGLLPPWMVRAMIPDVFGLRAGAKQGLTEEDVMRPWAVRPAGETTQANAPR